MKIQRKFTTTGTDVFSTVNWTQRSSRISNLDGSVVFEMNDAEVPESWSQLATDIMVSKYFRKAGVPQFDQDGLPVKDDQGNAVTGPERSARQVIHRLAGCWRHWGQEHGYFDSAEDSQAFYDELCHMMLNQMAAPNSPQWFNTGLEFAYGINGPAQGHHYADPKTGEVRLSEDAYTHPQPHACFIQDCGDDLVNDGGIMDLWVREARLFKYGSGTGTNFSQIRGEQEGLSGGGKSSGLMSFLKIGDRAAGAIKSGGTTRRAAKMVCLDMDHPDIEKFVNWKVAEEIKVAALVEGMKHLPADQRETAKELGLTLDYDFNGEAYATVSGQNSNNSIRVPNTFFHAVDNDDDWDLVGRTDGKVIKSVKARDLWKQIGYAAWRCADPGVQYDSTINEWHTCPESGRINASNPCSEYMFLDNTACNLASLNVLKFYDAKERHFDVEAFEHATRIWTTVLEISVLMAQFPSREIAERSYRYRTLGLGYANLGAMLMQAGIPYDSERGRAIAGCVSAVLTGRSYATSAEMAGELGPFPGYAENREPMLRVIRNHRRAAYGVSRDDVVAQKHALGTYETLEIKPVPIDAGALSRREGAQTSNCDASSAKVAGPDYGKLSNADELLTAARQSWDEALTWGQENGYRNAQSTVIAPTGTIGLLMDCDTTGVEPDFALVKFKKLAGGGFFKIANQSIELALLSLGYDEGETQRILEHVLGTLHLKVPMPNDPTLSFEDFLREKGLIDDDLKKLTDALPGVFELKMAINAWTLGEDCLGRMGIPAGQRDGSDPTLDLLKHLGISSEMYLKLNRTICGTQTVEGAPALKDEHLPVFDCANTCGPDGKRFIAAGGHIRMMAAAQPFISGAISKTINLPNHADIDAIAQAYRLSWELGLKANALYRDGCKLSQVLNNKIDDESEDDDSDARDQDIRADDLAVLAAEEDQEGIEDAREEVAVEVAGLASGMASGLGSSEPAEAQIVERVVERVVERPLRRRLADTRISKTHKFNVAGHEGYLTVGLYDDGTPGELFITMAKEGSTIGGLMDSLGTAISVALQYGVPVDSLVNKFTHQRFEPAGMTHNREIPFAKSLVDYIFRWMGMEFIAGYREANAPRRASADAADTTGKSTGKSTSKPTAVVTASPLTSRTLSNGSGSSAASSNGSSSPSSNGTSHAAAHAANNAGTATMAAPGLSEANSSLQADAPACDTCGEITVRNGTCYRCLNCGNSLGCS